MYIDRFTLFLIAAVLWWNYCWVPARALACDVGALTTSRRAVARILAAIIEAEHHVLAALLAVAINAAEERAAAVEPVHPRPVTPLLRSAGA